MKRVLVLGASGMLGSMVYEYMLNNSEYETAGTVRNFNDLPDFGNRGRLFNFDAAEKVEESLKNIIEEFNPDYIINCIGIINVFCRDNDMAGVENAIRVNSLMPHKIKNLLDQYPELKVIQIATDCVYSGKGGKYNENSTFDPYDVYGSSKRLGEVIHRNFLNIRCSIIGPEYKNKVSLLEWFLSNPDHTDLKGFDHHYWNGVTTLQFAEYCAEIIDENKFDKLRKLNHVLHYLPNETVSKYRLLHIFDDVFERKHNIERVYDEKNKVDRTLSSVYLDQGRKSMKDAVEELKSYIKNSNLFTL